MTAPWLDRAVHEALTVCPAAVPWEVRLMAIAMAPTIQAAAIDEVVALPILERAARVGINVETTSMFKDDSPGDYQIHYLADLEP